MRNLTAKQKKMADAFVAKLTLEQIKKLEVPYDMGNTWDEIEAVNPCEIFHQNMVRYMMDEHIFPAVYHDKRKAKEPK